MKSAAVAATAVTITIHDVLAAVIKRVSAIMALLGVVDWTGIC
jgi:hypothetical protein